MKKLLIYFTEKPKMLLLIDSIGAFSTALMLFVIMRVGDEYFGMPTTALTYLLAIAICYCMYSAACYLFLKNRFAPFIRFVGMANLLYCALTITLLIKYTPLLTIIDTVYFWGEICIICVLSYIEIKVAKAINI